MDPRSGPVTHASSSGEVVKVFFSKTPVHNPSSRSQNGLPAPSAPVGPPRPDFASRRIGHSTKQLSQLMDIVDRARVVVLQDSSIRGLRCAPFHFAPPPKHPDSDTITPFSLAEFRTHHPSANFDEYKESFGRWLEDAAARSQRILTETENRTHHRRPKQTMRRRISKIRRMGVSESPSPPFRSNGVHDVHARPPRFSSSPHHESNHPVFHPFTNQATVRGPSPTARSDGSAGRPYPAWWPKEVGAVLLATHGLNRGLARHPTSDPPSPDALSVSDCTAETLEDAVAIRLSALSDPVHDDSSETVTLSSRGCSERPVLSPPLPRWCGDADHSPACSCVVPCSHHHPSPAR